jgi:photosystem II stability/assembly factor-like uncharacterized protein
VDTIEAASVPVPDGDLDCWQSCLAVAAPAVAWVTASAGETLTYLLRTDDAGATWVPQLAWHGDPYRVTAFGPDRAVVQLGTWGEALVNGQPVPPSGRRAELAHVAVGHTVDRGRTWTMAGIPDETRCTGAYFTGPHDGWTVVGSYFGEPSSLAGTRDGGRTWRVRQLPVAALADGVAFRTATDGHLVAEPRVDGLCVYATGDGGDSWREQPLRLPKGVRRRVRPLLSPPRYADDGSAVMVLRADFGSESAPIPPAAGLYAYRLAPGAQTWSAPVKLPTVPSLEDRDLASYGRDGRLWAASGHDLWRSDDPAGPWTHTVVPLPDDVGVAAIGSYGGSTVWLATRPRPAAPPRPRRGTGSRLYRSGDGGASWQKVTVRCG